MGIAGKFVIIAGKSLRMVFSVIFDSFGNFCIVLVTFKHFMKQYFERSDNNMYRV